MPDDFNFGADLFGAPDPFGDPFAELGNPKPHGWEFPNSPNMNEQSIFDIYEKQFDPQGFLDIHDFLFNAAAPDPMKPIDFPEIEIPMGDWKSPIKPASPKAPDDLLQDIPGFVSPQDWVRPEQIGHSMSDIPKPEEATINDFLKDVGDRARGVPYGRSRQSFGRMPKTFWDRMESLLKRVDVANAEDVPFKESNEEESDDVADEENNEQEDEATGEESPDDENE